MKIFTDMSQAVKFANATTKREMQDIVRKGVAKAQKQNDKTIGRKVRRETYSGGRRANVDVDTWDPELQPDIEIWWYAIQELSHNLWRDAILAAPVGTRTWPNKPPPYLQNFEFMSGNRYLGPRIRIGEVAPDEPITLINTAEYARELEPGRKPSQQAPDGIMIPLYDLYRKKYARSLSFSFAYRYGVAIPRHEWLTPMIQIGVKGQERLRSAPSGQRKRGLFVDPARL